MGTEKSTLKFILAFSLNEFLLLIRNNFYNVYKSNVAGFLSIPLLLRISLSSSYQLYFLEILPTSCVTVPTQKTDEISNQREMNEKLLSNPLKI
jgi:hypothetical protein